MECVTRLDCYKYSAAPFSPQRLPGGTVRTVPLREYHADRAGGDTVGSHRPARPPRLPARRWASPARTRPIGRAAAPCLLRRVRVPFASLTCPLLPTPRVRWAFRAVWVCRCRTARCRLDSLEQLTALFTARQGLRRTLSTTTVTSSLSILSNTAPMPSFENLSFLNAFIT